MNVLTPISAAAVPLSDSEVTFYKFVAVLLMALWVTCLIKEIFFGHKRDPLLDALTAPVGTLTTGMVAHAAQIQVQERRLTELVQQQREEDTANVARRAGGYQRACIFSEAYRGWCRAGPATQGWLRCRYATRFSCGGGSVG